MEVRAARPGDLAALVDFNARMALDTEGKRLDRERLQAGVAAVLGDVQRGVYHVAEDGGRTVRRQNKESGPKIETQCFQSRSRKNIAKTAQYCSPKDETKGRPFDQSALRRILPSVAKPRQISPNPARPCHRGRIPLGGRKGGRLKQLDTINEPKYPIPNSAKKESNEPANSPPRP